MGDHFVLLVDRLLTESTLEAAIQSKNWFQHSSLSISEDMITVFPFHGKDIDVEPTSDKLGECRICHDEDEELNMEIPCSCRGSLKYAHRKCVQRWCNEKGDTICEICHQQFMPGYIAPPPLFRYGGHTINFRGNWEIGRRDLSTHQLESMVSTHGNFTDSSFDEYQHVCTSKSLICCRIIAVIFMVLLVLWHTLPVVLYGAGEYPVSLFMLLILRTAGILLPIYIMVKAMTALQRGRNTQGSLISSAPTSDDEYGLPGTV